MALSLSTSSSSSSSGSSAGTEGSSSEDEGEKRRGDEEEQGGEGDGDDEEQGRRPRQAQEAGRVAGSPGPSSPVGHTPGAAPASKPPGSPLPSAHRPVASSPSSSGGGRSPSAVRRRVAQAPSPAEVLEDALQAAAATVAAGRSPDVRSPSARTGSPSRGKHPPSLHTQVWLSVHPSTVSTHSAISVASSALLEDSVDKVLRCRPGDPAPQRAAEGPG